LKYLCMLKFMFREHLMSTVVHELYAVEPSCIRQPYLQNMLPSHKLIAYSGSRDKEG
jgi:hypothetical protein